MILTKEQAKGFYKLSKLAEAYGGTVDAITTPISKTEQIRTVRVGAEQVFVWRQSNGRTHEEESFPSLDSFATAYGLENYPSLATGEQP